MNTSQLSPYLNFNGTCREAMEFYQSVLGGKLTVNTFGSMSPETPADYKDKVMHADLQNGTLSFMASDCAPGREATVGNNIHMSIAGTDQTTLTKYFNDLSAGGSVDMPLEKQMWGDLFGMLTDKFGVHWMININVSTSTNQQ